MIVQSAAPGAPRKIIFQTDHALMSGQFAEAFGNDEFVEPSPQDAVLFVANHHDEGWRPIDARVEQDPKTGLPFHLTETPLPFLLQTSTGSPEFNSYHHPYCGILSSMHTCGLFNGRYGISDKVFIDVVPAEFRPNVEQMLKDEAERQAQLKEQLAGTSFQLACEDVMLFHNYKLLQFFDTLALYFQLTHEEARGLGTFLSVPQDVGEDRIVTIERLSPGGYSLSPYPFGEDNTTFSYSYRPLTPQPIGSDLKALVDRIEPMVETVMLSRKA